MELSDRSRLARRLASALEPVVGQVYFSPECHSGYVALGFAESPGNANGVALPDGPSYFASRGSVMGQVPGEVIAAAFGVFSPAIVVPLVDEAWQRTDAATIRDARAEGAVGPTAPVARRRAGRCRARRGTARDGSGRAPISGRPLAAGIRSLDVPEDPLAATWHHGDFLREYRGDSHNAAWVSAGLTATQIGLLTELYWSLPMRSYSRSRGWTEQEFDAAEAGLRDRGLLDGDGLVRRGSPGARGDRGRHRRPDGARARRPGRRRTRGVRDPRTMGCARAAGSRLPVGRTARSRRTLSRATDDRSGPTRHGDRVRRPRCDGRVLHAGRRSACRQDRPGRQPVDDRVVRARSVSTTSPRCDRCAGSLRGRGV